MVSRNSRYNGWVADQQKLYSSEAHGSGTFIITKPKRKNHKKRQTQLKNPQRGARR